VMKPILIAVVLVSHALAPNFAKLVLIAPVIFVILICAEILLIMHIIVILVF